MFGERLKEIRKKQGYTLEKLAELYNNTYQAGLNKGTLSKYENNKQEPMISVVDNLATILNVPTDYLLGRTNSLISHVSIGGRIKQRRLELNLSLDEVAAKLNKNRATVYRYESDDIKDLPTTVLEPLAKVLNTTPAYLMGWEKNLTKDNAALTVDLWSDTSLLNEVKKLNVLSEENRKTVFDMIDFLYQKEGH